MGTELMEMWWDGDKNRGDGRDGDRLLSPCMQLSTNYTERWPDRVNLMKRIKNH